MKGVHMPPRTVKEVIAAKRARQIEGELHRAERATDDTHVRVEAKRRQEAEAATERYCSDLNGILEDARRGLRDPTISDRERDLLREEEVRVLKLKAKIRI